MHSGAGAAQAFDNADSDSKSKSYNNQTKDTKQKTSTVPLLIC